MRILWRVGAVCLLCPWAEVVRVQAQLTSMGSVMGPAFSAPFADPRGVVCKEDEMVGACFLKSSTSLCQMEGELSKAVLVIALGT
ncbi:hypothetical protein D1007_25679 [Hordeum vulgare]|nr:hypothetical protein D1007_25679 [Hordeum vulgare]